MSIIISSSQVASPSNLVGASVVAGAIDPGNATAEYRLDATDGREKQQANFGGFTDLGGRFVATSDLECRYSYTGDTLEVGSAAINSWITLDTVRTWTLQRNSVGISSGGGDLEVRRVSDGTIIDTVTVNLTAEVSL